MLMEQDTVKGGVPCHMYWYASGLLLRMPTAPALLPATSLFGIQLRLDLIGQLSIGLFLPLLLAAGLAATSCWPCFLSGFLRWLVTYAQGSRRACRCSQSRQHLDLQIGFHVMYYQTAFTSNLDE